MDTPSLERLIVWEHIGCNNSCIRLKIGKAPKLRILGYLSPGIHMLEIRNTVINVKTILNCVVVSIITFACFTVVLV